ncbi:hypothetical protein [Deinococcus roseus]|uniref:DUF481 domain-containing protein n=1 Tax=Deinococcus roseus TaxID=392414 RepID=A0ABQ2DKE8_9DEIO|nr:hypothetical protein [Deinococcus roseus]GGJ56756.1 hypothetical protein GCM10008938_48620 [Deinococcus roseus]
MRKILLTLMLLVPMARATDLELGGGITCTCPRFHVELSQFAVGDSTTLLAGASDQALWLGADTTFDLGVAGNLTASLKTRYAWSQHYRIEGKLSGVLGSKATVNLQAHYGTASLSYFDQYPAFSLTPETDRTGFGMQLDGKYRLDRQWALTTEGGFGTENRFQAGAQFRESQNEYRFAALWQNTDKGNVFGGTAGLTWRDDNSTLTLDALAGLRGNQFVWGGKVTVATYQIEDFFDSDVKVFAAYEPYRDATFPFRYGLETTTPMQNGHLDFAAYFTEGGYAFQASYKFTLDPEPEEPAEDELNE